MAKRVCNFCKNENFIELSTGWKCNKCGKIQGKWAIRAITGWVKEGKTKITQKDANIIRKIRPDLKTRKIISGYAFMMSMRTGLKNGSPPAITKNETPSSFASLAICHSFSSLNSFPSA